MNYVGIDLHKKTICIWVVNQDRQKLDHQRLACCLQRFSPGLISRGGPGRSAKGRPRHSGF